MAITGVSAVGAVTDPTGGAASGANFNTALSNAAANGGLTPQEQQALNEGVAKVMGFILMNQLAPQLLEGAFGG